MDPETSTDWSQLNEKPRSLFCDTFNEAIAGCGMRVVANLVSKEVRGGEGAVVVVLRRRCFFSELRVITLKIEKYSTLKTTITDYLHQSQKPQQAEAAINFPLRHTFTYCTHMRKKRTPPVACRGN